MTEYVNVVHSGARFAWCGLVGLCLSLVVGRDPALADPSFGSPIACTIGLNCFIQNYVDIAPSTQVADFTCGHLTYEGHRGTDFRLLSYIDMEKGVDVLAAAPGTVLRTRDGMTDVSVKQISADAIRDRMAGNSVIVGHGNGWVTQYGHIVRRQNI